MTAAEAHIVFESETERIEAWRMDELRRAGYDDPSAERLASRLEVDLHLAVGLVESGCPPDLALRILL